MVSDSDFECNQDSPHNLGVLTPFFVTPFFEEVGVENPNDPAWKQRLFKAHITVGEITKGQDLMKGKTAELYFVNAWEKGGGRCPDYVALKEGQEAVFYIRKHKISDGREVLFLAMNSDVRDPKECEGSVAQENLFCKKFIPVAILDD